MVDEEIKNARRSLQAEILFRERLLEALEDDPDPKKVGRVWSDLRRHSRGDTDLFPGDDVWAQIRLKDWFRNNEMWDEDIQRPDT